MYVCIYLYFTHECSARPHTAHRGYRSRMMRRLAPTLARSCQRFASTAAAVQQLNAAETWELIRTEAQDRLNSPAFSRFGMDQFLRNEVLDHATMASSLAHLIGSKFAANSDSNDLTPGLQSAVDFPGLMAAAMAADAEIMEATAADLQRFLVVDPASDGLLSVYLFYKGGQTIVSARVAHHYWTEAGGHGKAIARLLQSEAADVFGVDIHPGAQLGRGITIDHATGVVIGETAVLGDNCYLMYDVTLGATGTSSEHDRHPKIGNDVFLGAKCTVIGNIAVGDGAVVAAQALVNKPVPPGYTAVGSPAKMRPPKAFDGRTAK